MRVVADDAPAVRRKILPATLQPAEEAKHVVGKMFFRVFGLPLHMTKRSVSAQLHREIGWAVLPIREIVRPSSKTATWVVTADEAPSEPRFFARFGGSRAANVVSIEAEETKTKGRSFAPNRWVRPQPTGPRYFNPYLVAHDDNDIAMADGRGAETVQYDDEDSGGQNKEGVFESAQESSDGAWGLVSRASRKKGKGKHGDGKNAEVRTAKGKSERCNPAPPPAPIFSQAQQYMLEEGDTAVPRQDASIMDLINALREDARQREEEANRRHQEQLEWMRRLDTTSGSHTTNLAQLNLQTAALNLMLDDLNKRMMVLESNVGARQGVAAAATPVAIPLEAAEVAVPAEDAEMADTPSRGRKGAREESPERGDEDGRPRSKRHAQEEYESAAEAEEASQL